MANLSNEEVAAKLLTVVVSPVFRVPSLAALSTFELNAKHLRQQRLGRRRTIDRIPEQLAP
jgi:hypothetical protein